MFAALQFLNPQMAHVVWNEDCVVTLNDTDSRIAYSGGWACSSDRGYLDFSDDVHFATEDGSYIEYTFTGTGVDYVTEKAWDEGDVDVYIDDVFQQTVSCSSSTRLVEQVVYSKQGLPRGSHAIKASKRNGNYMLLDALRVYP